MSASGARGEAFFARELAARAGVCHSLAKRAVKLAELDGLITVQRRPRSGRKHLANIIRIIRAEWLDWLRKGYRKAYATNACNRAKPIFAEARGVQNNPPRSQDLRNANSDRVDKRALMAVTEHALQKQPLGRGGWASSSRPVERVQS